MPSVQTPQLGTPASRWSPEVVKSLKLSTNVTCVMMRAGATMFMVTFQDAYNRPIPIPQGVQVVDRTGSRPRPVDPYSFRIDIQPGGSYDLVYGEHGCVRLEVTWSGELLCVPVA